MLYRWGLLVNRTKVLKYLSSSSETFRGVEFVTECIKCAKVTMSPMCKDCHKPLLYCSLCRLPVRGSANSCLFCGHGGHLLHMKQWFEVSELDMGCWLWGLSEKPKFFFSFSLEKRRLCNGLRMFLSEGKFEIGWIIAWDAVVNKNLFFLLKINFCLSFLRVVHFV